MLSSNAVEEIGKIFKFFYIVGVSPYKWKRKSHSLHLTESWLRLAVWKGGVLFLVFYTLHVLFGLLYLLISDGFGDNTTSLVMHSVYMTAYCTVVIGSVGNVVYAVEAAEYVNQLLKMNQLVKAKLANPWGGENRKDGVARMLRWVIPWVHWNMTLLLIIFLVHMDNPRFVGYYLVRLGRPAYAIRVSLEILSYYHIYFVVAVYWTLFFALFSTVTNNWIVILRQEQRPRRLVDRTRSIRKSALLSYRQLQVLNSLYNSCLSTLQWPSFILCDLSCHVLCIYIAVKLLGRIDFVIWLAYTPWAILYLIIDFVVFPHMGQTQELSAGYLHELAIEGVAKMDRVVLKSMRPLGVRVGYFFTMDRTTALSIVVIVSNLTINALLLI